MDSSYPLVICSIAIENGPVEIVDLPIENGGSFHSFLYVYQRVNPFLAALGILRAQAQLPTHGLQGFFWG